MRIAINAVSAQMGGSVTYLRSVLPALAEKIASNGGGRILVWARREAMGDANRGCVEQRDPGPSADAAGAKGTLRRLWFDQWQLPRHIRSEGADALFSSANFGTLRAGVRQVLLVRNTLYFDPLLLARIPSRSVRMRYAAQRALTLRSMEAADFVLFPSRAMLDLAAGRGASPRGNWRVAPYGARLDMFEPGARLRQGRHPNRPAKLLHVSLYSDQKNFGTLFTALLALDARTPGGYRLTMTAGLRSIDPGPWFPNLPSERASLEGLEKAGVATDLGPQPHASLPRLYADADVFVFSSYTESFGHPLVEAMASGLPVVAADVPINREMCGDAAVYFKPFDPNSCAEQIARVVGDPDLAGGLGRAGAARALGFTWERHADVLWRALRGELEVSS